MKMYNLFLEERFLLWDVCSIQLCVSCGNGGEELLSLAEAYWFAWFTWTRSLATNLDELDSKLGKLFSIENNKLRIQLVGKATYLSMWICWCSKKFYGMSWTHAQMFGKCLYSITVSPWKMDQMYANLFKSYRKNMFMKSKYGSI